ncbi:MAG TPA: hypothetical protein VGK50_07870 [Coriobacteriia bacterium]
MTRILRIALIAAVTFAGVLGAVTPALAAGPATFSAAQPAPGTAIASDKPLIAVSAFDPAQLQAAPSFSMKVDGLNVTATFGYFVTGGHWVDDGCGAVWVVDYDYTRATISYTPKASFAQGTHTAYVRVVNRAGAASDYTWSFRVGSPPTLSSPFPTDRSMSTTDRPTISAKVTGGTGATVAMSVDGTSVPATLNAMAGTVDYLPPAPLDNDATHTVVLTVTNGAGSATLTWSFGVQIYTTMPITNTGCQICHTTYPGAHPMTSCNGCHGPNSPVGEGWNLPAYSVHGSTDHIGKLECTYCHGGTYSSLPVLHTFADDTYHLNAAACKPCHVRSLSIEHNRYMSSAGTTFDCSTCHTATSTPVVSAIRRANVQCPACHSTPHGIPMAEQAPADTPLYPGVDWSLPQRASIWKGEPWMPDAYAADGLAVFSSRSTTLVVSDVWSFYSARMAANGWTLTSHDTSGLADFFVAAWSKGQRQTLVRVAGGAAYEASPLDPSGYGIVLLYR